MNDERHDTMGVAGHPWDELRLAPTGWTVGGEGFHESLLRSYRLVVALRDMIQRGDSHGTLAAFIDWVGSQSGGGDYHCQGVNIRLARQFEQITELEAAIRKGEDLERAARKHERDSVVAYLHAYGEHTIARGIEEGKHRPLIVSVQQADGHPDGVGCLFAGCERTDEHEHIVPPPEIPF